MTTTELKNIIDQIIAEAFETVQKMYSNKECNHIICDSSVAQIFPQYSSKRNYSDENMTRVSEQELRFAFVDVLKKHCTGGKMFYSVETPTEGKYRFPKDDLPRIDDENGKSGNFDLVIHNENLKRICLIEFKANYPSERSFQKDFLKLANKKEDKDDTSVLRYFIHMVVNYNESKIKDIIKAARKVLEKAKQDKKEIETVNYVLFSLNESDNKIIEQDISKHNKISTNIQLQEKSNI